MTINWNATFSIMGSSHTAWPCEGRIDNLTDARAISAAVLT
jgi:hypothetical protein